MALTAKHRLFVKEYLKDRNATRAYRAVYGDVKAARNLGHKLVTKGDISKAIEKATADLAAKTECDAERVQRWLIEIAAMTEKKAAKTSDRLKAIELLGKRLGMFKEVQEVTGKDGGPQIVLTLPRNGSEPDAKN